MPGRSQPPGDCGNLLPRRTGAGQGLDHLLGQLNPPLGAGESDAFFPKRAHGQHHVGVTRRFGQEQVLHDDQFATLQAVRHIAKHRRAYGVIPA